MGNILKNTEGKIWENTEGKIFSTTPFSQNVIQNGLTFWGRSDPNFLTVIDGLVSEAYDVREINFGSPIYGKMIQSTVANRPSYSSNIISFTSGKTLAKAGSTAKSLFLVIDSVSGESGIGTSSYTYTLSGYNNSFRHFVNGGLVTFYCNLTKGTQIGGTGYVILHTLLDANVTSSVTINGASGSANIKEWGWYNRVLNELEVVHNINALNARYSIF